MDGAADVSAVWAVVAIVCSYGLGTVPGAAIVAGRHGVDLRTVGDGNPGAWNALEQLGWRRAWPAFVLDGAKGLLAAVLGWLVVGAGPVLFGDPDVGGWLGGGAGGGDWLSGGATTAWIAWACVGAAMLGHAFPPWAPRSGGKSVMTFAGGALGLVPVVGIPLALAAAAAARGGRGGGRSRTDRGRGGLAARSAVFAFPVAQTAATPLVQVGWTGALMTLIGLLFLLRRS